LKDDENALKDMSKVKYFMMGKNEWRESPDWPPKEAKPENYYLSQMNNEKTRCVFKLSKMPPQDPSETHYLYDPNDPVPFRGSHHLHDPAWVGPFEQGELLCRKDVITYISEPLQETLEIAGFVKLIIYVSSSALDTDFCAKICDMRPSGESYNLQAGFVRMRYRESLHMASLIEPGKIYRLEIFLRSIAHAFLKDHRIQLQVTSCDFPVHDRNLNTGENCEFSTEIKVAEQTIYTGGQYLSHLVLPVLPNP
jgi:putative CocE/NonD family hydrolase